MKEEDLDCIFSLMRRILLKYDENTGAYRPIKGTTRNECYNTLGIIQEMLRSNRYTIDELYNR